MRHIILWCVGTVSLFINKPVLMKHRIKCTLFTTGSATAIAHVGILCCFYVIEMGRKGSSRSKWYEVEHYNRIFTDYNRQPPLFILTWTDLFHIITRITNVIKILKCTRKQFPANFIFTFIYDDAIEFLRLFNEYRPHNNCPLFSSF